MSDDTSGRYDSIRKSIRQATAELKSKNDRGAGTLSDLSSALGNAVDAFTNAPTRELNNIVGDLQLQSKLDEIITVGPVIVVYRPNLINRGAAQKEKIKAALTAILTANPSADLHAIQDSLGITVVNIQRAAAPPTTAKGFNG